MEPKDLDWLTLGPDPVKAQALIDGACRASVTAIERAIKVRRARDMVEDITRAVDAGSVRSVNRHAYTATLLDIVRDGELPAELRLQAAQVLVLL